jgi:hypothetical protein
MGPFFVLGLLWCNNAKGYHFVSWSWDLDLWTVIEHAH